MKVRKVYILLLILVSVQLGCKTSSFNGKYHDSTTEKKLLSKIDSLKEELSKYKRSFEPGKVYSRCSEKAVFESAKTEKKYFVYKGVNKLQNGVSNIQYLFRPAYVEWVKVNSSDICSAYTETENISCENWHLKEIPPVYKNEYIVVDTNKISDFEFRKLAIERIVKEAYITKVREFSCPLLIHEQNLVGKIQTALRKKGYSLVGAEENVLDEITKNTIKE